MKKTVAIIIAALASVGVQAQTVTSGTNSTASQASTVNVVVGSGIAGSSGISESKQEYAGEYSVKSAPTVYAPNLTTGGIETCLGSVAGGVSFMGGGFSAGSTTPDEECNVRMTANVAWKMGDKDLAVSIMCESAVYRKAAKRLPVDKCAQYDTDASQDKPKSYAVADTSDNKPSK